ncbi:MAG: nucleotidyltransferase domain-containing protein [DPANN group archaeon]|nr:nucleotidyltransferase domain-containing protein [DPANN group archaeon]
MFIESNNQKMLELFFNYPKEQFTIREIARRLNIAPPTSLRLVTNLTEKGYIQTKKHRHYTDVTANIENTEFIDFKKIYNLYSLSKLKTYLVKQLNYPQAIILYGSYSRGEDTEESYIDIFIVSSTKKEIDVNTYETELKRKIHIIKKSDFSILPKELKTNIINGIVLYGGIEC